MSNYKNGDLEADLLGILCITVSIVLGYFQLFPIPWAVVLGLFGVAIMIPGRVAYIGEVVTKLIGAVRGTVILQNTNETHEESKEDNDASVQ